MIKIQNQSYEIIENFRDGWDEEAFKARYSDVLSKYDFIVGDWGYDQLRLKGLFEDKNRKASPDSKIGFLQEYLYEYCNFGCSYFVIQKVKQQDAKPVEEVVEA
ncbi:DUF1027 domain-containing protein [Paenalkalicoccus suaedae]|uniref:DUF1027 domain-containing protein n=1 Tax=Paenalkalicoccus suaedae TaxID=2592382 RepID=A0A859FGM0_9BACI|nr:YutD-like domain-containing protein [Paenalkalicoccus suaedae]QKS72191.1 DUF1027 domain-containing protein [Paenalkalicoccus suaedae]